MINIRNSVFWFFDFIKRSSIKNNYTYIKDVIEGNDNSSIDYMDKLLNFSVKNTYFYSKHNDYRSINDFPIVNKNIIKLDYNNFISDQFKNKNLHMMSTSGSTGIPFTIKQNKDKRQRVLSELIYFSNIANYEIGDKILYLRIIKKTSLKNRVVNHFKNMIMINISNLNNDNLEHIRQTLIKDKDIKCLIAYGSTLEILSKYLIKKGDTPKLYNLVTVISQGEALSESTRDNLKKIFGCKIVSRYSNQEMGILAQEVDTNLFVMNNANYYIEFIKLDSDDKAEEGELARIVVTDLFNYAMPLIRYDTGDLGVYKIIDNKIVITKIEGRKHDFIYDTKGNLLSPSILYVLSYYKNLKQYQFIQEDKYTYGLKLNGASAYKDEDFITLFKNILGSDAVIQITHTDHIPILDSGKYRKTICKYKPI